MCTRAESLHFVMASMCPTVVRIDRTSSHCRVLKPMTISSEHWQVPSGLIFVAGTSFAIPFVSNCAAKGIDQRIIDDWVGHLSLEMVRRYRHLLPDQRQAAINSVFGRMPTGQVA